MRCGVVRFSYYKIANYTVLYGVMPCYLWFGTVMIFCEQFWGEFCDLVNTLGHDD